MKDIVDSLKNFSYHKLIIGASLTDLARIEDYAYCFASAGADVIDISAFPHSVLAAKKGISKASESPLIMVSVNIDQDPHFRRIKLNEDSCTKCQACIPSCPSAAFTDLNIFSYEPDLCFGCSNCLQYCDFDALSFEAWSAYDSNELNRLFQMGADAFEIHLGTDLQLLADFYRNLDLGLIRLESFSIGSEKMNEAELSEAARFIVKLVQERGGFEDRLIVIQCDGIPQSGARIADEDKDLKSIRNAEIVLNTLKAENLLLPNIFVQIAGGTNEKSLAKAHNLGIMIHGVAIGSWLRKRILELDVEEAKEVCRQVLEQSHYLSGKSTFSCFN